MPTQRPAVDELLAQSGWLRRLAGSLVAGEAAADDLVQETWLTALRHPPEGGRSPRPWLARIARNLAANFRRGEARRQDHERASPATKPDFDPALAAEAVELQRLLAEAVLRLDEPLRSAVVLRYVRGLDSRASGDLLGTPPGTVRWRLKRALETLRADLDQRFGDRERWCSALGLLRPIAPTSSTATPRPQLASPSVTLASTLASATLGVVLVAAWISSDPREEKAPGPSLAALAPAPDTRPEELLPAPTIETAPAVTAQRITRSRVSPSTPPHSPRALRAPIHGERFPDLPPGEYRLDVLAHDGRRYEPDSLHLSAPAPPIELRARGVREAFVLHAKGEDGPLDALVFVLVRGRWLETDCTVALEDVERWVLLARDHRPATGVPPESGPLEVELEPGWGGAFLFVDASTTSSRALGPPLAGVVVLAEGVPVATSDSTGLALVSFLVPPDLEQGWREEQVWSGGAPPVYELLRD